MPMEAIKPARSLVDQVHATLLDAICDGRLLPGTPLTQDELAARLGVSRQPVMAALAALHRDGFACERGKRGLAVAPVDRARFDAIYELRTALEPLVARLAAERASAAQRRRLKALVDAGRAAVTGGDAAAAICADVAFHSALYEACGNPLVLATMAANWQHLRRSMGEVLRRPHFAERVWREHAAIAAAVAAGDGPRAGALMQAHVAAAHARVGRDLTARAPAGDGPARRAPAGRQAVGRKLKGNALARDELARDELAGHEPVGHEPAGHEPAGHERVGPGPAGRVPDRPAPAARAPARRVVPARPVPGRRDGARGRRSADAAGGGNG